MHFGGGSWGLIAVAFFDSKDGILYAGNLKSGYVSISVCFLDSVTSIFISHVYLYMDSTKVFGTKCTNGLFLQKIIKHYFANSSFNIMHIIDM